MPPVVPVKTEAVKPADKGVSEWERVRKELHGAKSSQADSPPRTQLPDLTDFLLKLR